MKNLLLCFLIALPLIGAAQSVPNGNFENWVSIEPLEHPEFWTTDNSEMYTTVTQDPDAYEGQYAMRVTAQPTGVGEHGEASTLFEISAIPEALNFYAKWAAAFGGVVVDIAFLNNDQVMYTDFWTGTDTMPEYTLISMPLEQIEPVITHVRITVSAQVGDLVAGNAWISIDAMDFGQVMHVQHAEQHALELYPNPTRGMLNIESEGERIGRLSIYNVQGAKVHDAHISQQRTVLDMSHLPKGLYLLVGHGSHAFSEKFVLY